jgi:hypothetical protein
MVDTSDAEKVKDWQMPDPARDASRSEWPINAAFRVRGHTPRGLAD